MFEKRLFSLVPEATPYIVASVACKWLALLANVAVMWMLATLLEGALAGVAASLVSLAPWLAVAILVRATAIYLAQRAGELVERGMHGQLLRASGVYARMWESQESLSAYASAPEAVDGEILAETIQYGAVREREGALDELTDAVGAVDARLPAGHARLGRSRARSFGRDVRVRRRRGWRGRRVLRHVHGGRELLVCRLRAGRADSFRHYVRVFRGAEGVRVGPLGLGQVDAAQAPHALRER